MLKPNYVSAFRNPFTSFWMAGFECTDKLNRFGTRVDFLSVTGHLQKLDEDYKNLSSLSMRTVREGIRWSVVEKTPFNYNWKDVEKIVIAATENDLQVVWDLCHFGFPDDLTPLHPMFPKRFSELCRAFVRFYRSLNRNDSLIVTPFNEVSFLAWLGGEVGGTSPFCTGYGIETKYKLMKAYIEGIEAIKHEDNNTRILTTEPLVNMVPPLFATQKQLKHAKVSNESQFEVLEILSGNMYPELRGKPEYVDIIGCNYYYNNQWVAGTPEILPWVNYNNDPRWQPMSTLIKKVFDRYQRPIVLSETSHPKEDRPSWMNFVADECINIIEAGVPLWGICWYPVIDRPDWDHLQPWHHAGVWDIDNSEGKLERILHEPTANAILNANEKIAAVQKGKHFTRNVL
jgi:beta-glucosidase/6-phospho-beta-glucosidase/beta-galactosidase